MYPPSNATAVMAVAPLMRRMPGRFISPLSPGLPRPSLPRAHTNGSDRSRDGTKTTHTDRPDRSGHRTKATDSDGANRSEDRIGTDADRAGGSEDRHLCVGLTAERGTLPGWEVALGTNSRRGPSLLHPVHPAKSNDVLAKLLSDALAPEARNLNFHPYR